jgi:hypothetical protein
MNPYNSKSKALQGSSQAGLFYVLFSSVPSDMTEFTQVSGEVQHDC